MELARPRQRDAVVAMPFSAPRGALPERSTVLCATGAAPTVAVQRLT
jgi:hypothetical protein